MDNFINILRNTPATGASSATPYGNGVAMNDLAAQYNMANSRKGTRSETEVEAPKITDYAEEINRAKAEIEALPDGFVKNIATKLLNEQVEKYIKGNDAPTSVSKTPSAGVSSEDTYDNGVGFFAPLSWQFEKEGEYSANDNPFPSDDLVLSYESSVKKEEKPSKEANAVEEFDQMKAKIDSLPEGFVKTAATKLLKEQMEKYIKDNLSTETKGEDRKEDKKEETEDIEYTYKDGDTFGQVLLDLGLSDATGKDLWGPGGDVEYYTNQLHDQDIWGNVPIGRTIKLKRRS